MQIYVEDWVSRLGKMGVVSNMKPFYVIGFIVAVRLASVFLVQTWFVPDEYWQSLEVAHKLVFGYGSLTWEWTSGIRSYLQPAFIAGVYKVLELLTIDHAELLILLPRILQALLSAAADYSFYKWSGCHKWALFLVLTQWFWFYSATRTLVNTTEASLITIALARFPFTPGWPKDNGWLCLAALSCAVRPTAAIIWMPLCVYNIVTSENKKRLIGLFYIPIGLSILGLSTLVDSYFHGELIFTPYEFLKLNVLHEIGSFYGSEPWYWYFAIGFPTILGINLFPLLWSSVEVLRNREVFRTQSLLLFVIVFTLSVYSTLPHKEFRFILSLIPMALFITQDTISRWSRKAKEVWVYLMFGVLLLGSVAPIGYFSLIHQRGVMDAMPILRDIADKHPANTSLLFLMPCHSTPLYSHLHVNIPVRFLTCEPNLSGKPDYKDEADQFFEEPLRWFQREYLNQQVGEGGRKSKLPSHLITFDSLAPKISSILAYYNPIHTLFHSDLPLSDRQGYSVMIYERVTRNSAAKPAPAKKPEVPS